MFNKYQKNALVSWSFFIAIVMVVSLHSCTSNQNKNEISDEIILKIGSIEITKYEFEKKKEREYKSNPGNYQQWLDNFIDETYILTDAYQKKYDTLSIINKKVNYAAYSMISEVDGYLWKKVEEPKLVFSNSELKKTYYKRNKIFYLEYLQFPNKITMTGLLNSDTIVRTEASFNNLVNKCKANISVKSVSEGYLYPFDELWPIKDIVYNLKQGEITKPLHTNNGIFIIHFLKGENNELKSFKTEKDQILSIMQLTKRLQIIEDKQKEVFSKAKIKINEKVINTVLEIIKNVHKQPILPELVNNADTLMVYTLDNQKKYLLVRDFIDYCTNNPFMLAIDDMQKITQTLKNYTLERYLYTEAESLGIIREKQYVLDKRNYKNRLMVDSYNEKEFSDNAVIPDQEIRNYYQNKKQNFAEAIACYVSIYIFKDKQSAFSNYSFLNSNISQNNNSTLDPSALKGLVLYKPNIAIERDNKEYAQDALQFIFNAPVNQLSMPIENNNCYILVVKNKQEGSRIKTYNEVKEEITRNIKYEKENILRNNKLKELKRKYALTVKKI